MIEKRTRIVIPLERRIFLAINEKNIHFALPLNIMAARIKFLIATNFQLLFLSILHFFAFYFPFLITKVNTLLESALQKLVTLSSTL